jgi:hypothetical protein
MYNPLLKTLLIFLTVLLSLFANAQIVPDANGTVYVKDTATGLGNGNNWANATANLQGAINAAGTQKVFVATGNYDVPSPNSFVMKNGVGIYGGFDPDSGIDSLSDARILPNHLASEGSVLNGKNERPVVWNVAGSGNPFNNTAMLDGFTIKGGNAANTIGPEASGGGIHNEYASPTLRNLVIKENSAYNLGGGIFNNYSSPVLTNIIIISNTANNGGGGVTDFLNSSPVFTNVGIFKNTTINGCGLYQGSGGNAVLNNVTIADNIPDAVINDAGSVTMNNSIVYGAVYGSVYGSYTVQHSLIEGDTGGVNGNLNATGITAGQLFFNALGGDYRLKYNAPAVDTGDNTLFTGLGAATDLAGNQRLEGSKIDLGAYEFTLAPKAGIIYVMDTARGFGNGSSWANATSDLQGAINATGTQKVFVATGNYDVPSPSSFVMKNGVEIYGGFDPDNGIDSLSDARILPNHLASEGSVLNGKNERPVVWNVGVPGNTFNNTAVLDGFTIKGGNAASANYPGYNGGGIHNEYASPTFRNLVIKDNIAGNSGGGISNTYSSPVLTNVIITGNTANNRGGGVENRLNSSPVLTNVGIFHNTSINSSGGLYNASSGSNPILNNVTIADNIPDAVNIINSSVTVNNSVIYGGIVGSYTVQHSLIEGNTGGANGNLNATGITAGQLFFNASGGDYRLKYNAPAVDTGDNTLFAGLAAATDLAGNQRLEGSKIDLGAYEFSLAPMAGIIYVMDTARGFADGSSWANATSDLQGAINATGTQKVFVATGNYDVPSPSSFVMKNGVEIYGGFDPDNGIDSLSDARILPNHLASEGSVLNGKNERPVIWNVASSGSPFNNTAMLDGFTIKEGNAAGTSGGGIHNEYASPMLRNLVIKENSANVAGGGIYNNYSSPVLTNVIITDNTAGNGGGGMTDYFNCSPVLTNVGIFKNTAISDCGGLYQVGGGNAVLNNVTIADNTPNAVNSTSGSVTVNNSVVYGGITGIYTAQHSLIEGNTGVANGNLNATGITSGQLFFNASGGDYRLKYNAPAVDTGDNTLFAGLVAAKDLAGNQRLEGPKIDLGAYESRLAPKAGIIYVMDTARGFADGSSWANATSDLQGAINATGTQKVFAATGNYDVPSPNSFVMKNGVGIYGGFDPDNGIDSMGDTRIMMDTSGMTGSILNGKNERNVIWNVFTSSAPMDTAAILDGFTLSGGNTQSGGGGAMRNVYASPTIRNVVIKGNTSVYGGGIYNSNASPTLYNVIIKGNIGLMGGGLYNSYSSPTLYNVVIKGNTTSGIGGGILNNWSVPLMKNVLIENNSANEGGGIYNNTSSPTIGNCIIRENTAVSGAAIYNSNNSGPTLNNVLITGNTATGTFGSAIYTSSGIGNLNNVTIANNTSDALTAFGWTFLRNTIIYGNIYGSNYTKEFCLIQGNADTANHNINATGIDLADIFTDPSANDYTLLATSPAANAGNNASFDTATFGGFDLAGNARIYGPTIDIGAYELQANTPLPIGILSFTAEKQGTTSLLEWATTTEVASDGFVIERSTDSKVWSQIGYRSAQSTNGNGTQKLDYSYTDNMPFNGINFYRLKQRSPGGKFEYSPIRAVSFDADRKISIYPNPASDNITINGLSDNETIALYDISGKLIKRLKSSGVRMVVSLDDLPEGTYLILVTSEGGTTTFSQKFVKVN